MALKPAKPAGKCIFCGGGDLSKEHIWPSWANPLLNTSPSPRAMRTEERFSVGRAKSVTAQMQRHRPGNVVSKRLRVVCRACNHGWMSAIEETAKPILTKLILGVPAQLSETDQTQIARWVCLKVLVTEQSWAADVVSTPEQRETFMMAKSPLEQMSIMIADCGEAPWNSAYFRTSFSASLDPSKRPPIAEDGSYVKNVQFVSFGVGRAVFFVLHANNPDMNVELELNQIAIKQIWPFKRAPVYWPPLRRLTRFEASGVAGKFAGFQDLPNARWID